MKENEEITNLERFELLIEDCKGHRELYGESSVGEYDIEIMQHILSDYKRVLEINEVLLKENEELKFEERSRIIGKYGDAEIHDVINGTLSNDYIPVQKVKGKIEELNDVSNAEELEDIMNRKNYTITELVQYVLQELLEGRK